MSKKKVLPVGFAKKPGFSKPFVLNWAKSDGKLEIKESTDVFKDTCFSEVADDLTAQSVVENIATTKSGIAPGELLDTSY